MATTAPSPATAQRIRDAGVKATRGRVRVLEILDGAHRPLRHGEISTLLGRGAERSMDRVTLYRVLDSLVACGLALKAVDPRGVFRFSPAGARHRHLDHVHFRCTGCGGVFCLEAEPPSPPRLPKGFRLEQADLDLRGLCAGCGTQAGGSAV